MPACQKQESAADKFFALLGISRVLGEVRDETLVAAPEAPTEPAPGEDLSKMSLAEIAAYIRKVWPSIHYGAKPYLSAMFSLNSVNDYYGFENGRSVVSYFLTSATKWRGPEARAVKAELKRRLRGR